MCWHYLVTKCVDVEVFSCAVAPTDVEGCVFGLEGFSHGLMCGFHEFSGDSHLAMRTQDGEGGNVTMDDVRFVFHFR